MNKVTILGHGYVSGFLTKIFNHLGWNVICTSRKIETETQVGSDNIILINFFDPTLPSIMQSSDIILSTVPPNEQGIDPVLYKYGDVIAKTNLQWIGYLSSTSVYGNYNGAWIDETAACYPSHEKAKYRLIAERQWLNLYDSFNLPVHIFRLSGIYGPGRNCLEDIMMGKDFTIIKKNHYFSRIHIEDICRLILASINFPTPGETYNISDGEPATIQKVHQFGAAILGRDKLKEILEEKAIISQQLKMFFNDNKKVNGEKILKKLGMSLIYPNYRTGLLDGCLPYLRK